MRIFYTIKGKVKRDLVSFAPGYIWFILIQNKHNYWDVNETLIYINY